MNFRAAAYSAGILVTCGLAATLAWVPGLLEQRVRAQFADMGEGYVGSIEDLRVDLLAGEIAIVGLRVEREQPPVGTPFMQAGALVIGLGFDGLWPRTRLRFESLEVNLVDFQDDRRDQWGPPFELASLREQLPFELASLHIIDGEIHWRVFDSEPAVDTYITHVDVRWTDLAGCVPPGDARCDSQLHATGQPMASSQVELIGGFAREPESHVQLSGSLRKLDAKDLGPLLLKYADVDLDSGSLGLDGDYERTGEHYRGTLVPRLADVKVLGNSGDLGRLGRELGLAFAVRRFTRARTPQALRFRGTQGRGDFDYEIVDAPASIPGSRHAQR